MKTIELQQGSPEWLEWRASRFTASDAPAMLGISPYKTRAELLREKATSEAKEYSAATRARFAAGHYAEEKAREMMEAQIGEELFPCVGEDDDGRLAASFDGMTMNGEVIFEHKLLNNDLRRCRDEGAELPEHYRAQMEHQIIVSDAIVCVFVASKWDENGELAEEPLIVNYHRKNDMRSRILDGWKQFASDLETWQPEQDEEPELLRDINAAISPLHFTHKDMEIFGLRALPHIGRTIRYPAGTLAKLCDAIEQHICAVRAREAAK